MKISIFTICIIVLTHFSYAQNSNLSGGIVFEGEPYMMIDPVNPQHIVVAWMGFVPFSRVCIKVKTTFNGGTSWSSTAVIPHQSSSYTSADISLDFDHSGNVYACYIDSRQSPDSGGVYICRSTDGGVSWGSSHLVIGMNADGAKLPIDRPWLVIGRTSGAALDTFYVTTKPAPWIAPPNRPYFTKSTDNGITWSAIRYIDSTGYKVGSLIKGPMAAPSVDSAGRFHCVYPSYYPSESIYPRLLMASGSSVPNFDYKVVYTAATGISVADTLAKAGYRLICDRNNNRHFAFFSLWSTTTDIDVAYYETFNAGTTWTGPVRVNADAVSNGKMQDLVWANFDDRSNIVAAWRDRRNASGTGYAQPSEIWGAIKWRDSVAFSANFRISDTIVAYDSVYLSGNGNDFMNVAMAQDTLSAVWGDVRTGTLNIWFSRKNMKNGATSVQQIVKEELPVVRVYPNPANSFLYVEGVDLVSVILYDITGKKVIEQATNKNIAEIEIAHLAAGNYTAYVRTKLGLVTTTVVKR